jgi:hypothetical protein
MTRLVPLPFRQGGVILRRLIERSGVLRVARLPSLERLSGLLTFSGQLSERLRRLEQLTFVLRFCFFSA